MSIFNTCCKSTEHRKWWLSRKSDMCHCVTIISEKKCWFEQVAEESNQWTGWWFQLFLFYRKIWEIPLTNISWKLATTSFAARSPFGAKGLDRRNTEDPLRRVQNSPLSYSQQGVAPATWHHDILNCGMSDLFLWQVNNSKGLPSQLQDTKKWNSGFGCFWYLHQTKKTSHIHWFLFNSLRRSNPLKPMVGDRWRPIFPASVSTEILAMTQIRKYMCLFLRIDSLEEIGG